MIRFVLLVAVALPSWAQQTQTPPAEPKKEQPRRPLNLQLDNPSSFATTAPEEKPAKDLPALGGDARTFTAPKREGTGPSQTGPFPKDSNPNR